MKRIHVQIKSTAGTQYNTIDNVQILPYTIHFIQQGPGHYPAPGATALPNYDVKTYSLTVAIFHCDFKYVK